MKSKPKGKCCRQCKCVLTPREHLERGWTACNLVCHNENCRCHTPTQEKPIEEWRERLHEFWRFKMSHKVVISLPSWEKFIESLLQTEKDKLIKVVEGKKLIEQSANWSIDVPRWEVYNDAIDNVLSAIKNK